MKYEAIALSVNEADVMAKLAPGDIYENGMIFVTCQALGQVATPILCRYGLSLPGFQVVVGAKLLIESIRGDEVGRWYYTGFSGSSINDKIGYLDLSWISQAIVADSTSLTLGDRTKANAYVDIKMAGDVDVNGSTIVKINATNDVEITGGANVKLNATSNVEIDGSANVKINGATAIELNGNGDYAVAFDKLKAEFNELKGAYNGHTHSCPVGGGTSGPTSNSSSANIDEAKVATVKLP